MLMIEVYSPSVDRSYDFQIDEETCAFDALKAFSEMIAKKNGCDLPEHSEMLSLFDIRGRRELDMERSLKDNGVVSGMKLIIA